MSIRRIMHTACLVACISRLAWPAPDAAAQSAGLAIEQTMEFSVIPGQPPMASKQNLWLAPGKIRMEMQGGAIPGMGNMTTIIRTDLNKVYMVDENAKTYMEMPADMAAGAAAVKIEMKATGQKKKIKEWNCEEYIITGSGDMADIKMTVWASEDIKVDGKLRDSLLASIKNPMLNSLADKLREIKGFPVEQSIAINMGGMPATTATRLNSVAEQKIPDDKFEVPAGYVLRQMFPQAGPANAPAGVPVKSGKPD